MKAKEIEIDDVLELLPKEISLVYFGPDDNLNDHHKLLQGCLSQGSFHLVEYEIDNWFDECKIEAIREIKKDLINELQSKFDIKNEDATNIIEDFEEEIEEEIYWRSKSSNDNILSDLISNTLDPIMHYDTGYEMESDSWNWTDKEVYKEMQSIKKVLGIRSKKYNEMIEIMIRQASSGGMLLIYFKGDIERFTKVDKNIKSIKFSDAWIGIIDHMNGSGDVTQLDGISFKIPFSRYNVFYEKSIKYNWTDAISGSSNNWCDSTSYNLLEENKGKTKESKANDYLKQEEKYDETFRNGSCTTTDMDISRHRNVSYRNTVPCGNICEDCSTFWID